MLVLENTVKKYINNPENQAKIEKLSDMGYPVEYSELSECFRIYTSEEKTNFILFSDDLVSTGNYMFDMVPFFDINEKNSKPILTRFKLRPVSDGNYYASDEDAKKSLIDGKEISGNIKIMLNDPKISTLIGIIDDKSDIAHRISEIHKLISAGVFEIQPTEIKTVAKKNVLGENFPFYKPYSEYSFLTRELAGKRIRYNFAPYALNKEEIGRARVEIIDTNNAIMNFNDMAKEKMQLKNIYIKLKNI